MTIGNKCICLATSALPAVYNVIDGGRLTSKEDYKHQLV